MKQINSSKNPLIKKIKYILRSGKDPTDPNGVVIEGDKLLTEAIRSGCSVKGLFFSESEAKNWPDYYDKSFVISDKILTELSCLETPSKVVGWISLVSHGELKEILRNGKTVVVLEGIQDPGNLGTIIRTCEALYVDGLILLAGCCSPKNGKVLRAAMGSAFRLPVWERQEQGSTLEILDELGYTIFGTSPRGNSILNIKFPEKVALVFGSEGRGISSNLKKQCKELFSIPIRKGVESLNVASAVSICLFERVRCMVT